MKKFLRTGWLLIIFSLFLVSCVLSDSPSILTYFKKYTENVTIAKHTFGKDYPTNSNDLITLDSLQDCTLSFDLINPQAYILTPSVNIVPQDYSISFNSTHINDITITQKTDDPHTLSMTIPRIFLEENDGGKKFICSINCFEPLSGRNFSYEFPIDINTPPPKLNSLCVMESNGKYVLCFNMPKLQGTVHELDTRRLQFIMGSKLETFTLDPTKDTISEIFTDPNSSLRTTEPENLKKLGASGQVFVPGDRPAYYETGIALTDKELTFEAIMTDDNGFSSSFIASNVARKLNTPTFSEANGAKISQSNANGTGNLTINAPTKATDGTALSGNVDIYYKIEKNGEIIQDFTMATNSTTIQLQPGNSTVTIYASKDMYISSSEVSATFEVELPTAFVNADFTGQSYGNLANPFTTLQEPMRNSSVKEIKLLTDLTISELDTVNRNLTISSYLENASSQVKTITMNNFKIELGGTATELTLDNVNINSTTSMSPVILTNQQAVILKGSAFVSSINLFNSAVIKVGSNLTTTKTDKMLIEIDTPEATSIVDTVLIKPANGYTLTASDLQHFELKNSDYQIVLKDGNGVVAKKPEAYIGDIANVNLRCSIASTKETDGLVDGTFSISVSAMDSGNAPVDLTGLLDTVNVTIKQGSATVNKGNATFETATNTTSYSFTGIPSGIYQVIVSTTINGIEYSKQTTFNIQKTVPISMLTAAPTPETAPIVTMSEATELQKIADWVKEGSTLEDVTITLADDVDVSEINDFTPIGIGSNDYFSETTVDNGGGTVTHFNGVFEGNGKTIRLNVDRIDTAQQVSLFAVNEGTIQNVVVEQFSEDGEFGHSSNQACGTRVAGICMFNNGIIKNCIVKANMKTGNQGDMAGICIYNNGTIINCAYTGTIENTRNFLWGENCIQRVGGIAATNNGTIINCINTGTLINNLAYNNTSVQGSTGGIVAMQTKKTGDLDPKVQNCYWRRDNCTINANPKNYLVQKAEFTLDAGYEKFYPNPTPETITACGYFESLTGDVTAGDVNSCGIDQTLNYSGSVIDRLNAFINEDTTYGDLKKWTVIDGKLAFEE